MIPGIKILLLTFLLFSMTSFSQQTIPDATPQDERVFCMDKSCCKPKPCCNLSGQPKPCSTTCCKISDDHGPCDASCVCVDGQQVFLVNIQKVNPRIKCDIRYATTNNFTGKVIYPCATCCVRAEVAQALDAVQKELETMGLGLLIWDGYRSLAAQWTFWNICPDERYVTDPRKGGRHTRGTAVDLTLVDLKTGKELEMPTEFDNFTPKAWRNYQECSEQAKKNRALLEEVMTRHGFTGFRYEWWHFDFKGWESCPVLDVDMKTLS